MRRIVTVVALLSWATVGPVAGAVEPSATPPVAQPAAPAPEAAKITRSRSNIQNNREAAPPEGKPAPAVTPEAQGVVKTKTKSNQSND
ncbi:MAG: hypothetical protein RLZZ200_1803 [Pseudomonadota bacterium]|jgi:hypothetical protein